MCSRAMQHLSTVPDDWQVCFLCTCSRLDSDQHHCVGHLVYSQALQPGNENSAAVLKAAFCIGRIRRVAHTSGRSGHGLGAPVASGATCCDG